MAENYYYSSLSGDEIEQTLLGAVRFNTDQNLTTSQKAAARANIGAGEANSTFKVLGYFNTLEEMQAALQTLPKLGDAYGIGTESPYDVYVYAMHMVDGQAVPGWVNQGPIDTSAAAFDDEDISLRTGWTSSKIASELTNVQRRLVIDDVPTLGSGNPVASGGVAVKMEWKKIVSENVSVPVNRWASSAKYDGYGFRAQIPIENVTVEMIPEVIFDPADVSTGTFATIAESYNGGIYIYASEIPASSITIPTIIVWRGDTGDGSDIPLIQIDPTLTVSGAAADAKAAGDAIRANASELADQKSAINSFEGKVFEESSPNFIRLADIPETEEAGLTYSLTDNYLDVSGTTTEALTKYLPLLQPIPAGNYYFTNFMTHAPGIINGTFNLITTDNQFILLSGQNVTNLAVTIPEGKTVDRLSIYFGANRLETSTYRFCLTDYQLPTPAVYPEDTIELAPTITNLLDAKYDTDAVTPNRAVCWGDSLTDGAPTYSYPSILQSLITAGGNTITVENGGQGGETSLQIAVRQGSIVLEVNPATIPASGDVTITMDNWNGKNIEILTRGGAYVTYNNPHLLLNPVFINGVAGNVLRNSSGDIVFTRTESGAESQFTRPVKMSVIADADYNLPTDVTIIWAGTNDTLWDIEQTITTIKNMVATLANEKYIIVGLTAKVHFNDIEARNFAMANTFGKHFLNVRDYILAYGLADAGITPTAQDETDIANGEIPASLRVDTIHFNEAGYTVVANQVYKKGQELEYWV